MNTQKTFIILISAIFIMQIVACDGCKTEPDTHDATPPAIDWTITNKTRGPQVKIDGSGSYAARLGDQLSVTACVNDDGGVNELTSSSSFGYSCAGNGVGQNVGPSLAVIETTPLGLDENGKAWSRYCKIYALNLNFSCSPGMSFNSGGYSLNLSGKNFSGLSTSATLSISVTP